MTGTVLYPGTFDAWTPPGSADYLDTSAIVHGDHHDNHIAALIALEQKLGRGTSYASGTVALLGTGGSASAWGQITSSYLAANAATKVAHQDITTTVNLTSSSAAIAPTSLTEFLTLVSGGGDLAIMGFCAVYCDLAGVNITLQATLLTAGGAVILDGKPAIVTANHSGVYYLLACTLHVPATTPLVAGTTYVAALRLGSPTTGVARTVSASGGNGSILAVESRR